MVASRGISDTVEPPVDEVKRAIDVSAGVREDLQHGDRHRRAEVMFVKAIDLRLHGIQDQVVHALLQGQ